MTSAAQWLWLLLLLSLLLILSNLWCRHTDVFWYTLFPCWSDIRHCATAFLQQMDWTGRHRRSQPRPRDGHVMVASWLWNYIDVHVRRFSLVVGSNHRCHWSIFVWHPTTAIIPVSANGLQHSTHAHTIRYVGHVPGRQQQTNLCVDKLHVHCRSV